MKVTRFRGEYGFLSNFWPSPVNFGNYGTFPTVEHAYQAAKADPTGQSNDPAVRAKVEAFKGAVSPGQAKKKGKAIRIADAAAWNTQKMAIMKDLLDKKFQIPEFRMKLKATGEMSLEEGNHWGDTFWGIDIRTGEGENHLGKLLMQIRREIR